jgi:hypothetical protein
MTLPTVIEITPQLEAVTPDTFIDRWAAVAHAGKDPARDRTLAADCERSGLHAPATARATLGRRTPPEWGDRD